MLKWRSFMNRVIEYKLLTTFRIIFNCQSSKRENTYYLRLFNSVQPNQKVVHGRFRSTTLIYFKQIFFST